MRQRPVTALFDIDGTLALHHARNPYDWRTADADELNEPVALVLHSLHRAGVTIVYVSGRSEEARSVTENWLRERVGVSGSLFLRAAGDSRRDSVIKREIYRDRIRAHHDVIAVFDDRDQVVRMWRESWVSPVSRSPRATSDQRVPERRNESSDCGHCCTQTLSVRGLHAGCRG